MPQNLVGEVPQKLKGGVQGEPWFPFKEGSKGNLGSLLRRGSRGTFGSLFFKQLYVLHRYNHNHDDNSDEIY